MSASIGSRGVEEVSEGRESINTSGYEQSSRSRTTLVMILLTPLTATSYQRWINIRDLDAVFARHGKADESGRVILDLNSLGYDKLLGGGSITAAYMVKVDRVSESARSKIEATGGGIITDEQYNTENLVRRFVKTASVYIPQVPKPKKKITLTEKLVWTGIALLAYLVMAQIPLYGVTDDPRFDFLAFARVIFAAQQGTLMELGIGPIVTAGLLMQLLKGSGLIKMDFKNPDDRSLFTSATKIVTIIVIVAEGTRK